MARLDSTLFDNFCQRLATFWWFSPGTLVSSVSRHDITEILLKMVLKHHKPTKPTIYNQETSLKHRAETMAYIIIYWNLTIYCTLNTRQEILTHSFSTILLMKEISSRKGPGWLN
jgi:hypothetical protein